MSLNDEPTTDDRLGHGLLARRLAQRIALEYRPPYVLGIHGDWGSGKTSFLRQLAQLLDPPGAQGQGIHPGTRVVFFEAWRHQFEVQPAIALLHTIREHFSLSRQVRDEAGKLAQVSLYTGLRLLDDLATSLASLGRKQVSVVETARAEGERLEQGSFAVPLASEAFRDTFEQAIAALTRDREGRPQWHKLVVLIDDLDRCDDAAVVRLLESLKLYLNAPNCVFVIAADRAAVVRALRRELFADKDGSGGSGDRASFFAQEYAEKLFQSVQTLPVAWKHDALLQWGWEQLQRSPLEERVGFDAAAEEADRSAALQRGRVEALRLRALQTETRFLPPNPRKVKRFLTELDERLRHLGPDLRQRAFDLLCALQALQTFHPDLYRLLEYDPDFWEHVADFARKSDLARDLHPAFADLRVPGIRVTQDPQAPARTAERWPTFHDPAEVGLLRCAALLRRLDAEGVTRDDLYGLLQGQAAPSSGESPAPRPSPPGPATPVEAVLDREEPWPSAPR